MVGSTSTSDKIYLMIGGACITGCLLALGKHFIEQTQLPMHWGVYVLSICVILFAEFFYKPKEQHEEDCKDISRGVLEIDEDDLTLLIRLSIVSIQMEKLPETIENVRKETYRSLKENNAITEAKILNRIIPIELKRFADIV